MTQNETHSIQATDKQVESWMASLTLEEKVSLMAGASSWTTVPIERLGIPAMKVTDGPNGARGRQFRGGPSSACFPVGIALAATWNTDLVKQVGGALAEETRTKQAQMLLAPTVNIQRSPLNGRNFECYSEDPFLTARMAVAYINGLQNQNIGATVKHFVCNDSEFERHSISSEVNERALREMYLPPFQAAVQEAKTWSVMSAYNKVNGTYASANAPLLIDILKNEWGFDGFVMSDWWGTYSTVPPANGGLDLEMPGPAQWRGEKLLQAVEAGEVEPDTIDEAVRRILHIIVRSGVKPHEVEADELARNQPEHQAIARQAATEGIVLLRNQNDILPLELDQINRVAIIGPNAKTAQIMGGGSSYVNAHYAVSPYDGLVERMSNDMQIGYEIGSVNYAVLPFFDSTLLNDGHFSLTFYNKFDLSGDPVYHSTTTKPNHFWHEDGTPGVTLDQFSVRMTGQFIPQESGLHSFSLVSAGLSRLLMDGNELIDNWTQPKTGTPDSSLASLQVTAQIDMVAGQTYELCTEYSGQRETPFAALRLGHHIPVPEDSIARAAALAADSDIALVFVGLNGDWESEGFDRPDMELVGQQVKLIEAVAAANPRTVVVLQTGSPVVMPWLDKVAGVIQAWYPGQECGNAITDVLVGDVNPSGKLPQTFPMRLEDNPAYINYPGENGRVHYGEGIYVGYRYYEKKKVTPLFPFGYGLSYTIFTIDNLRLSTTKISPNDTIEVSVDVTNTGNRPGQEVVQLYVHDVDARLHRPHKELKAFQKVALEPGEVTTVTMKLDMRSLAYWDDSQHAWVAEAGDFEVCIGNSSANIQVSERFILSDTVVFDGPNRIGE